MNLRFIIILGVLLASGVCSFATVDDEEECNHLGDPCDSDSNCCPYGERCLSSNGKDYYCNVDPGP
uniref:KTx n=1 Tax=Centruroides hentzi TaxID=88313 RepID=A0A2I9LP52_9SCOR